MNYPKPLMSISELNKMGFPRDYLYKSAHCEGCERYVTRTPGKGKILFDVEKWEKIRGKQWR